MKTMRALLARNTRLFFKDKGMFFTSLITPLILLVLYVTFLGNVYRDSFQSAIPAGLLLPEKLMNGFVGSQLLSSLLAVSCVTVSFCANMLMVMDKTSGAVRDLTMAPVRASTLAIGYYLATLGSALLVNFVALGVGLLYLAKVGWYLSLADVVWMILDVVLLVMFGTALSSIVNSFLSTQGQISAVGTVVSAGYGFLCGAYMPISNFSLGLQHFLGFLPGTYGTVLLRRHTMAGVFAEMGALGIPSEILEGLRDGVDCNLYFFGKAVGQGTMYGILAGTVAALLALYVLLHMLQQRRKR